MFPLVEESGPNGQEKKGRKKLLHSTNRGSWPCAESTYENCVKLPRKEGERGKPAGG